MRIRTYLIVALFCLFTVPLLAQNLIYGSNMENDPLAMRNVSAENPEVVNKLTAEYEKWFDEVSSTRPDNYEPPRIHIGSPSENPVTLTRQDWRHIKDRPWAGKSNGFWKLHVVESGSYDFNIRFKDNADAGSLELEMGDQKIKSHFSKADTELTLSDITLARGDADLRVTLKIGSDSKGPWQVEVQKR